MGDIICFAKEAEKRIKKDPHYLYWKGYHQAVKNIRDEEYLQTMIRRLLEQGFGKLYK